MENLNQVDDMVCEYLLFRGFTNTFKTFESDRENDRTHGFNVDKIVNQLFGLIEDCDFKGLKDTWDFLNSRFFCLLNSTYMESVESFKNSLRKLYIVTCIKQKNTNEVTRFFQEYCPDVLTFSEESARNDDWRRWCSLQYLKNPENDGYFTQFFSTSWKDSLRDSLINFMRAIFQNLSPPSLLGISIFKTERQRSQAQIQACKSEIKLIQQEWEQTKNEYASLLSVLAEIKDCVDQASGNSLQTDIQSLLKKVPLPEATNSDLRVSSDTSEHGPMSRQASAEFSPKDSDVTAQAISVTNHCEVGVFSEGIDCCKWSRDGKRFAAGGGEGMLMVYNYDPDEHKSELFSSYSCGNEILTLDWSHSENAPNSGLVVYGTQEGTLGVFNSLSNTLLHETTVEGVSAVVDVAFSPVMTSYCSALASGPSPLRFWDLASGAMALDGAGVGAGVRVNCVQYIPNGAGLFCGCGDGHVRLFDIRGGKSVSDEKVCDGEVSGLKLAVSVPAAGSATLFACGTDGIVREFDYRNLSKAVCEYALRKVVTTTAIPKSTIAFSSSHLLAVAANHLDGVSLFTQGQSKAFSDGLLDRLSGCLDLCPGENVIVAGTTDCSLELVSFGVL